MRQRQLPSNHQPSSRSQRQSAVSRESAFLNDVFYTSNRAKGLVAASIGPMVDLNSTRPVGALEFFGPFFFSFLLLVAGSFIFCCILFCFGETPILYVSGPSWVRSPSLAA